MKLYFGTIFLALFGFQGCAIGTYNSGQNSNRAESSPRTDIVNKNPTPARTDSRSAGAETPRFDAVEIADAVAVIRDYYAAINNRNFEKAYALWSGDGEASGQTFEEFQSGFAETAAVRAEIGEPRRMGAAAGSRYLTVPVTLEAKTTGGETQRFAGEYVLRRSVVDGASAEQRAWRIYSADIERRN